ncbi:MAG: hypothetical protein U5K69_18120 [Balneolaceae bacterium]|nr:hypothetical protein [Balneolaceae bacterium]
MEPFEMSVTTTQGASPIRMKLVSNNLYYPDSLMMDHPPRPDYSMPKPRSFTNGTIWKKTVSLDSLVTVSNQQSNE